MPIYAIIKDGVVENTVEYPLQPATPPPGFNEGYVAVLADGASPGWRYLGGAFIDPTPVAPPQPPAPDWDGFRLAVLGGVFTKNYPEIAKLYNTYPAFVGGIQYQNLALCRAALDIAAADHTADPLKGLSPATITAITVLITTYRLGLSA